LTTERGSPQGRGKAKAPETSRIRIEKQVEVKTRANNHRTTAPSGITYEKLLRRVPIARPYSFLSQVTTLDSHAIATKTLDIDAVYREQSEPSQDVSNLLPVPCNECLTQEDRMKSIALVFLVCIGGCIVVFEGGLAMRTDSTVIAPIVHSAEYNRTAEGIAKLDAIQVKCPSFFDAPLGNKPCPAQELIDSAKAILQQRLQEEQ